MRETIFVDVVVKDPSKSSQIAKRMCEWLADPDRHREANPFLRRVELVSRNEINSEGSDKVVSEYKLVINVPVLCGLGHYEDVYNLVCAREVKTPAVRWRMTYKHFHFFSAAFSVVEEVNNANETVLRVRDEVIVEPKWYAMPFSASIAGSTRRAHGKLLETMRKEAMREEDREIARELSTIPDSPQRSLAGGNASPSPKSIAA